MRALVASSCLFLVMACSDDSAPSGGACPTFDLAYQASISLSPMPSTESGEGVLDAATNDSELTLLVAVDDGLSSVPSYELWIYNTLSGARLARTTIDPPGECVLISLTHDAAGTPLLLAGCDGKPPNEWRVYALEENALSQRHTLAAGHAPQLFAHDDTGDRFCFFSPTGISSAAASAAELAPMPLADAPGWGPTTGFDCNKGMVFAARDAFEAGMSNQLLLDEGSGRCTFDLESTEGLTGQPELRVVANDDYTLWVIAPDGTAARFSWAYKMVAHGN